VSALGAPLLYAHFPRAYLDVNREPYELDPALIRDGLPHYANTQSVRVVGGLGTIARIVSESDEIYREPSLVAALERINRSLALPRYAEGASHRGAPGFGLAVWSTATDVEPDRRPAAQARLRPWRPLRHRVAPGSVPRAALRRRLCCG
jgi:hypothetical protein